MNDTIKTKADYAPNEKKVWRPEFATQVVAPHGSKLDDGTVLFLAIESLQGAFIDGKWEEADSNEEWTETETVTVTDSYTDAEGIEHSVVTKTETVKDFHNEIPRSQRYVLKRFTETGFAENAFSSGYAGPRKYVKN
ncbi:hypothetical protein [Mycetocola sp.]|uniref:hypothetical protein n=1 Tax=Mycetocola sp. TaxID=1871042 RepID=UPI0039899A89